MVSEAGLGDSTTAVFSTVFSGLLVMAMLINSSQRFVA